MLSIEKCRELLPDQEQYSDDQIEEIRTSLYGLAELALDVYFERKRKGDLKPSEGEKKIS